MFVGREEELRELNRLYERNGFQMVVLYGRRRVGKTTLVDEFARGRRTLAFTAQQRTDRENLADFSARVYRLFGLPISTGAFATWDDALSFVASRAGTERLVVSIDEFPYAAQSNPALPSALQVAIDHELQHTNVFLILTGSNQGFMESEVLGERSPLFGRRTAQIRLGPFDCLDAARMLVGLSAEELVRVYACLGGTPHYLAQYDTSASLEENVERLFFSKAGMLYEEPLMLLRQELREPALYSSILAAIAAGCRRPKRIADRIGSDSGTVAKYLQTLCGLGIVGRRYPVGENPATTRKGAYVLEEACYAYWYRFVAPYATEVENGLGPEVARRTACGERLDGYVGQRFESVCREWLRREARADRLPIGATLVGSWWGNDPVAREQTDIDAMAVDTLTGDAVLCECKWRNAFDETRAIERLRAKRDLARGCMASHFWLVSKRPATASTVRKYAGDRSVRLVSADDLFRRDDRTVGLAT